MFANHALQHDNLLSCANISLLLAIRCYMLIMYCSKEMFLSCVIVSLLIAVRCCISYIAAM